MSTDNKTIGMRIKQKREESNISQEKLGEIIGVTYQQIQKYEKGTNKVSAERLYKIAEALKAPVEFFFREKSKEKMFAGFSKEETARYTSPRERNKLTPLELELVDCLRSFPDEELRLHLIGLLRSVRKNLNLF